MPTTIMSAPAARHPLLELLAFIGKACARHRARGDYAGLLHDEVTADIAADCVTETRACARAAHSAETHDREALRLLQAAQDPASPGGPAITPAEARPIAALITRSAETDHDLAERTSLPPIGDEP